MENKYHILINLQIPTNTVEYIIKATFYYIESNIARFYYYDSLIASVPADNCYIYVEKYNS